MFMLGEGGEGRYGTNINYLLEQFGMAVNSDSVVRTVYYKYLHPKVRPPPLCRVLCGVGACVSGV